MLTGIELYLVATLIIFDFIFDKFANVRQMFIELLFIRFQSFIRNKFALLDQIYFVGDVQPLPINLLPPLARNFLHLIRQSAQSMVRKILKNDKFAQKGDSALQNFILSFVLGLAVVLLTKHC